jgi:hypothetical protein
VRLRPQCGSGEQGINTELPPPHPFVAVPVQFAMVGPAQRHREFIADLARQRAGLREFQMVGIRRAAAASKAG